MNLAEFTDRQAALMDVLAWAVLGTVAGYVGHRLPTAWLRRDRGPLGLRRFERGGGWYQHRLRIKRWKDRLPEAGGLFRGGVSKRSLLTPDRDGLEAFAMATRRAEIVHWALIAVAPLFVLWNPWWLAGVMVLYALGANGPCLLVQRYNRARVQTALDRARWPTGPDGRAG